MTRNYLEQDFEEHIEENLLSCGYHRCLPEGYDRETCLLPAEVLMFIKDTQPNEYKKLEQQYAADTPGKLMYRLSAEISRRGTLHVLRKGISDRGTRFNLVYFKPSSGMNPEHTRLYQQNRFSVVRQLKYSIKNEKSIDMVVFLNGLPVVTMELKNSLTGQMVDEARQQYQKDRDPKEALLQFKRCLVHLAVGNEQVFMTTKLKGDKTFFLPFNKDTENPVNPNGHKTAYLWQDILTPDTLLSLIQNYLHIQKKTEKYYDPQKGLQEKEHEAFIFPRYHQLDVTTTLLDSIQKDGVGKSYLVQHSAGSGKSNSIAWLAHQLAGFYQKDSDTARLFDSIVVVTDRRVLDRQLQDTIKQFEQVAGVVCAIDVDARQLKHSLESGRDIIITTLQKFPVISQGITELKGKRFAVIIDEAHSSQSGEGAKHLKETLSTTIDKAEEEDKEESDIEETIIKEINARGKQPNISYFAFTATPKNKTLELFGKKTPDGGFEAHHVYCMRQAIEEGFILDVLENYTTFERYFKLKKKYEGDKEYEKKKAVQLLTSYVDLQPHALEKKTALMLDHFLQHTVDAIQRRGRAMVVTRSRLHAVRYYLEFKRQMEDRGLKFKPLVAFSGTVKDPDSAAEFTETGLNQLPQKVSIPDALKTPDYRILIVAEKFQTGFDEPMLHTMYVDKKLEGVHAVQALSRLNRTMRGKSETTVLDFVNNPEDILTSFQPYYQTTLLEGETDPNKLYDIKTELEQFDLYTKADVDEFAAIFFNEKVPRELLQPTLDKIIESWRHRQENVREDFRGRLKSYFRLYGFLSQLITFTDVDLEKLYVFTRSLSRKLPPRDSKIPYEIRDAVDLDSFRIQQTFKGKIALDKTDGEVKPPGTDVPPRKEGEKDLLSNIIRKLNDTYGINITEEDKIDVEKIHQKHQENQELKDVMDGNNTKENKRFISDKVINDLLMEFVNDKLELYKKLTEKPEVNAYIKQEWFDEYHHAQGAHPA
ncbi:MAG: type I restriction endonuclease subunit R [Nitrospirae bacterium]|nr:type I restriction endonuclease subunit R [Nitrospirota bacterium]MBF0590909.1 type I restriction endonuclease subunit R [Nitrospirota bacterium]